MKILLVNTLYYPNMIGGAELSVQTLAESLVIKGHDVIVASLFPSNFTKSEVVNGVKTYYIGLRNVYWPFINKKNEILRLLWHFIDIYNPLMMNDLTDVIIKEKPDIIHTNNLSGFSVSSWVEAKRHHIPLIHTIRDYYLLCHLSTMHRNERNCTKQCIRCRLFSELKKKFSNLPDSVVGISGYILKEHLKFGCFSSVPNTSVIYNSYQGIKLNVVKGNKKNLRLGFLGRIEKKKGIDFLLKSLKSIAGYQFEVHIGGTGKQSYVDHLKKEYRKNVFFYGFVNPSSFLTKIDVLVVPSLWNEPFGRIIAEAYYYGIPVIGSQKGGIPELIDNGKTGYVFDPAVKDSLISIVKNILKQPDIIKYMQSFCLEKSKLFLPEKIAAQYIDEYYKIL